MMTMSEQIVKSKEKKLTISCELEHGDDGNE